MVGEKDTDYGRIKRAREFERSIQELRGQRTDIFPVTVTVIANHPHSGLPDREKIAEMFILSLVLVRPAQAADEWKFPWPQNEIARYTVYHIREPIRVDGKLDEEAWRRAPSSPRFSDIITGRRPIHDTRAYVLWDQTNLYVAYRIEEPFVHATFTANNAPIWQDHDVELFIAGRDAYYEFEINAFNTTYEVFFIWTEAYERGGFAAQDEFERSRLRPFNGVGFGNHPRGRRFGSFDWHFPGKQTAVFIDGTVNDDTDRDRGWTVELAFPWKGMAWLAKAMRERLLKRLSPPSLTV